MSEKTSIEWVAGDDGTAGATWNPIRGTLGKWHCSKISAGCAKCYAEAMNHRFGGPDYKRGADTFRLDAKAPGAPLRWRKARRVFVCSMTDLFHEDVPDDFVRHVFAVMSLCGQHTFMVLTKRADRMSRWFADPENCLSSCQAEWVANGPQDADKTPTGRSRLRDASAINGTHGRAVGEGNYWPLPNVWLGTSAENQQAADERIPHLLRTPAAVRWLSAEPLLGPVDLTRWLDPFACECCGPMPDFVWRNDGTGVSERFCRRRHAADPEMPSTISSVDRADLDWVVAGGESGHGCRPCDVTWVRSVVGQCREAGVPCFAKQLGGNVRWDGCQGGYLGGPSNCWPAGVTWTDGRNRTFAVSLRDRKGGDPSEWPEDLRVRQFPKEVSRG